MKKLIYVFGLGVLLSMDTYAQGIKIPAPSPLQTVTQQFGVGELKVEYSRPGAKGRKIFGDVVPFSKRWRTGANSTTKITFSDDVSIQGQKVPAGTYVLLSIPEANEWTIIFNKNLTLQGDGGSAYKESEDQLRIKVQPKSMNDKIETFTIALNDITNNAVNVDLMWENTRVTIPVSVNYDDKVMKQIDETLIKDSRPYFAGATYYYENNKDLNKALEWATKAAEMNPTAFWIWHLKAKIQNRLGDYKGAVASATASKEKAQAAGNMEYVKFNEAIIAQAEPLIKTSKKK